MGRDGPPDRIRSAVLAHPGRHRRPRAGPGPVPGGEPPLPPIPISWLTWAILLPAAALATPLAFRRGRSRRRPLHLVGGDPARRRGRDRGRSGAPAAAAGQHAGLLGAAPAGEPLLRRHRALGAARLAGPRLGPPRALAAAARPLLLHAGRPRLPAVPHLRPALPARRPRRPLAGRRTRSWPSRWPRRRGISGWGSGLAGGGRGVSSSLLAGPTDTSPSRSPSR